MSVRSIHALLLRPVLTCAFILLLAGCAAYGSSNARALLGQDYQQMTNAELTAYEQKLSEEIALSGSGAGNTSIGFGLGSWGSDLGVGLGVNQNLGGGNGGVPIELRDRREAVRIEMRKRGLLPPVQSGK